MAPPRLLLVAALLALALGSWSAAGARNFATDKALEGFSAELSKSLAGPSFGDDHHKLVGTNYKCVNATGHYHFCIGMTFLPSFEQSTGFEPFGTNYTDVIQFNALSVYDKEDKVMRAFASIEDTGATAIYPIDVFSANLVAPPVELPVVSFFFVGVGIKMGFDAARKSTIVTGLLPFDPHNPKITHAFYEIDAQNRKKTLDFTLESIVPKGFFQLGNVEILGTKLAVVDNEGVFWEGIARNSTKTLKPEFVMVGVDVEKKAVKKTYPFPIGDCEFLGSMTYDPLNHKILMPTLKTGTKETIIMGEFDPATGSCVQKHVLDYIPFSGLLELDPALSAPTATMLVGINSEGSKIISEEDLILPNGMVALPLSHPAHFSGLKSVETGEEVSVLREGPVPPMPQKIVNYDLKTGKFVSQTHKVCEPVVARDCPWQMYWAS